MGRVFCFVAYVTLAGAQSRQPVTLVTSDIDNFWKAYDASQAGSREEAFQKLYLDAGSPGLKDFVETPLPLVTVMLTLVGALSLMMGLLAELVIRTYYESQDKRPYLIAEELNRPEKPLPRAVGH